MNRISITNTLEFSQLIYGMWRLADDTNTSPNHVETKIQTALDQGITTFDQADIYGGYMAETVLGGALKANPALRAKMEIVSKCDIVVDAGRHAGARVKHYDTSRAHIQASVDASLLEMGIEHIDLLLIHRPDPLMDHHITGAALDELVATGKVGAIGVSNFRPWDWDLLQSAIWRFTKDKVIR
jgi:predicted oxidoreductase